MKNKKPVILGGINLTARFNKKNLQFISRFALAVFVPVLAYFGLSFEQLNSWPVVWDVFVQAISNPYVVILTIVNGINVVFDSTHSQLRDTDLVLERTNPKVNSNVYSDNTYESPQGFQYPEEDTPNATMEEQMDEIERQQEEEKLKK